MNDARVAAAAAQVHASAPELAPATVTGLVVGYLDAAEAHDLAVFTAHDVAGAVSSVLHLGVERPANGRIVRVTNPTGEHDGWESPHTVVDVITDDAPFLVDSVSAALVRRGYDLHLVFHPLLAHGEVELTSHLHLEIDRETDAEVLDALRDELASVVDDVFAAVADWDTMRAAVVEIAAQVRKSPPPSEAVDDVSEATTFLEWLADDHFTFVGAVRVDAEGVVVGGSERGVARRRPLVPEGNAIEGSAPWMLVLTKALARSTVHRDVPLDCVYVRRVHPDGTLLDEMRFVGLYTANVYSQSAEAIPLLRQKVARVAERSGFAPRATTAAPWPTCSRATRATSCSGSGSTSCASSLRASCAWACAGGSGSS